VRQVPFGETAKGEYRTGYSPFCVASVASGNDYHGYFHSLVKNFLVFSILFAISLDTRRIINRPH